MLLTPFKLIPTYKDYVWGGKRLRPEAKVTAEAWVVYEGNLIEDGVYAGLTLAQAAERESSALLGRRACELTGSRFPLLIKLLDCARWLSLQVHPNDEQAELLAGPGFFGKTEAWYVVDAQEGAQLISGFKDGVSQEEIKSAVGRADILDLVVHREVYPGDSIFMAPGTIHALGPGLMIYEVQQTSDLTYRVYDWDRPITGRRVLHIDQAIEVLDPEAKGRVQSGDTDFSNTRWRNLFKCQYFALNLLMGSSGSVVVETGGETFSALTLLDGQVRVKGDGWSTTLTQYETLLIPALCRQYRIVFDRQVRALEARVP
jgi:mannose-6-phosphate isomerase